MSVFGSVRRRKKVVYDKYSQATLKRFWQKMDLYPHCNTGLRKCDQIHHLQMQEVLADLAEVNKIAGFHTFLENDFA